jgi:hypothetical protein
MAVTAPLQPGGQRAKRWIVTFGLDADTTATLDHGFNGAPDHITITPLNAFVYVGQVFRGAVSTTQIIITKNAAGGSGGASVEVVAYVPHSSL